MPMEKRSDEVFRSETTILPVIILLVVFRFWLGSIEVNWVSVCVIAFWLAGDWLPT